MRKFFGILILVLLGLVGLIVTAAGAILLNPGLVLNEHNFRIAAHLLEKSGLGIRWDKLAISVETHSFLDRTVVVQSSGLCVEDLKHEVWKGCFERADVSGRVAFKKGLRLIEAGPVTITGGEFALNLDRVPPSPEAAPEKKSDSLERFLNLRNVKLHPFLIDLERVSFTSSRETYTGRVLLNADPWQAGAKGNLSVDLKSKALNGGARFALENAKGIGEWNSWVVNGDVNALLEGGAKAAARIAANPAIAHRGALGLDFKVDGSFQERKLLISADLAGKIRSGGIGARLNGKLTGISNSFREISVEGCDLDVARAKKNGSHIRLSCPVLASLPGLPKEAGFLNAPKSAGVLVLADIDSSDFIPAASSRLAGKIDLTLNRIASEYFSVDASVRAAIDGPLKELIGAGFPGKAKASADLSFKLDVPRFEKLVAALDETPWAIPAPVRVLRGDCAIEASGRTDFRSASLPLALQTSLHSPTQQLRLDADTQVRFQRYAKTSDLQAVVDLILKNVQIQLPRLDLGLPPAFVPEPRIYSFRKERAKKAKKKPSSVKIHYLVNIKTPPGAPVKILTNLAAAPVPVNLDLTLGSEAPVSGNVSVDQFPVDLFHAKATVQYFRISLTKPTGASSVDGSVQIPKDEYLISANFVGSIDKPVVKLVSNPSLPENQILALLIFNQSPDTLDMDQSSSVGSTQQALSGGALNLASIYLLASTPVQSVGYDPATGEVTAKVKLAEGTSLVLGSSSKEGYQSKSVGIRKRLGQNWSISSEVANQVDPTTGTSQQKVTNLLQWSHRY